MMNFLEKIKKHKKVLALSTGLAAGLLNGLFGSGGGVAAVPLLGMTGLEQKRCHASSVALILGLSIVSTVSYSLGKTLDFGISMRYIPFGIIGAVVGATALRKIDNDLLRRIFGVIIIVSAIRTLVM